MVMSFEQVAASLLIELHQRKYCTPQLGNEEALVANFEQKASIHGAYRFRGQGRGILRVY